MTKGSRQCAVRSCSRQATGALLQHGAFSSQPMLGPSFGQYGCQEHLEEATRRIITERLSMSQVLVVQARKAS